MCFGQSLAGKQVMSLRSGAAIGQIIDVIIDPNSLKIEGWETTNVYTKKTAIVLGSEIRDILPQGIVVNDHAALSEHEDLVRLKPIIDLQFELINKPVITDHKKRLGKVSDYAFDKDSLFIKKIYVNQPLIKSLSGGSLVIDRTQVVEVTNRKIVVREPTVQERAGVPAPALAR